MGISKFEFMEAMEKIAPNHLSESWDNCGMQINLESKNINKILIALEITKKVIDEAVNLGVDFIVTHHPLYFSKFREVSYNNITGTYTINLIQKGISVYSAHTNFDKAEHGNNYYLAKLLNMDQLTDFNKYGDGYIGISGRIDKKKDLKDVIEDIKNALHLKQNEIRFIGNSEEEINKIGICTGAGCDMIEIAALDGCQVFITGDVKYHDAIKAKEMGINVIDAGHYGTEKIFVPNMAKQLNELFKGRVEIYESQLDINPFDFF